MVGSCFFCCKQRTLEAAISSPAKLRFKVWAKSSVSNCCSCWMQYLQCQQSLARTQLSNQYLPAMSGPLRYWQVLTHNNWQQCHCHCVLYTVDIKGHYPSSSTDPDTYWYTNKRRTNRAIKSVGDPVVAKPQTMGLGCPPFSLFCLHWS